MIFNLLEKDFKVKYNVDENLKLQYFNFCLVFNITRLARFSWMKISLKNMTVHW